MDGAYIGVAVLARNLALLTARAAGNEPIDAVYTNVRDLDALNEESVRAHHDGFAAKAIIDPPHAEIVNRAFRPAEADLTRMRRIVEAMEVAAPRARYSWTEN